MVPETGDSTKSAEEFVQEEKVKEDLCKANVSDEGDRTTLKKKGNLRQRKIACGDGAAGGAGGTMLQFYTDDSPGLKISPNVVVVMSIGFIAFVTILHVMGKLYFVRGEA
ncbi:protein transport protein SBH1-like [Capsicum chacoense]